MGAWGDGTTQLKHFISSWGEMSKYSENDISKLNPNTNLLADVS